MLYAILTPEADVPLGYYDSSVTPTPEDMADHMAEAMGYPDRDTWLEDSGVKRIGYAPVH